MTELTHIDGVPGAVVIVDPRIVQTLAIDLLDEEPEPMALAEARRFQVATETPDEEPERQAVSPAA